MDDEKAKEKRFSERFLDFLRGQAGDRGVMADLRHGFSSATEYRAWPHLARWCDLTDDRKRKITVTVAAGFAVHGSSASSGNLGHVLRRIAISGQQSVDEGLKTFDARFRRLLTCARAEEVCEHLPGILRAAERKDVPVCFAGLYEDLLYWGERVKLRWAQAYWGGEAGAAEPQSPGQPQAEADGAQ